MFLIFAVCMLTSVVGIVVNFVPKARGKTLGEIASYYIVLRTMESSDSRGFFSSCSNTSKLKAFRIF